MRWMAALLATLFATPASAQTTIRFKTVLGDVDLELFDADAPQSVANFLNYLRSPDFDSSFVHRSVPDFVIQGGGFAFFDGSFALVPTDPPVPNEFDPARSNVRGTIAMAKLSGDPDSATSQWFINLADNSASLDTTNGGFTVFGRVQGSGMAVVDAIAALPVFNATIIHPALSELPLRDFTAGDLLVPLEHLVLISRVGVLAQGECGDVDDDQDLTAADRALLRGHLADPGAELISAAGRSTCNVKDVQGSVDVCDVLDSVVLARAVAGPTDERDAVCFAAVESAPTP